MHRHTVGMLSAAAASIALAGLSFGGAGTSAAAATQPGGPPVYSNWGAGYQDQGRWFRFVASTLTVAPRQIPNPHSDNNGAAQLALDYAGGSALIGVDPGGGAQSVWWLHSYGGTGSFNLAPKVGDQLRLSIYYDRHGHTEFTATDLTQGITRTHRVSVGNLVYTKAWLVGLVNPPETPSPAKDTQLWHFSGSRVTTYTGVRGTILGSWETDQMIVTTDGTPQGAVMTSPGPLWHQGQSFRLWLRHW